MVKKFVIGIMTVIAFTSVVSCQAPTKAETTTESTVKTPTPILTPTTAPSPTPTPAPVKAMGISEGLTLSEGQSYYVTFYCACQLCCGPCAQGICADGTPVSESWIDHSAAADSSIPFGTRFVIPELSGYEVYTVHDRGSAVHGAHVDIYVDGHSNAASAPVGTYQIYFIE